MFREARFTLGPFFLTDPDLINQTLRTNNSPPVKERSDDSQKYLVNTFANNLLGH